MLLPLQILNLLAPVAGTDILNAEDVESASEVTAPALAQTHVITADDVESASEVTNPAIGQEHALLGDDVESASEVSAATIDAVTDDFFGAGDDQIFDEDELMLAIIKDVAGKLM